MISLDKKYRTRVGREVRLYVTDCPGDYPVHGAVKNTNGNWCVKSWTKDGRWLDSVVSEITDDDLIEVKQRHKRTVWVNVYDGYVGIHRSKDRADNERYGDCLACIKLDLDFEEGEGL